MYVGENFSLINIIDHHSLGDIISMTTVTKILGLIVNNLTYVLDQGILAFVSMCLACAHVFVSISTIIMCVYVFVWYPYVLVYICVCNY